jgi:hypothetical protein
MLPIDLIVEIGILAGPNEYEELAKTSKRDGRDLRSVFFQQKMLGHSNSVNWISRSCPHIYTNNSNY